MQQQRGRKVMYQARRSNTRNDRPRNAVAAIRNCDACGGVVQVESAGSYVRWGDVWFCWECWGTLPEDEIKRLAHAVALRGVPLS